MKSKKEKNVEVLKITEKEQLQEKLKAQETAFKTMRKKRDQAAANIRFLDRKLMHCDEMIIHLKKEIEKHG